MQEYEITLTYLNGCAGAAYPLTSFEEAELQDPADYIRAKHSRDFAQFTKMGVKGVFLFVNNHPFCRQGSTTADDARNS